jgi:hypothetical protein
VPRISGKQPGVETMKIITDHKYRNTLYGYELPERVRGDFDYLDSDEFESHSFVQYRGHYYDVGEFMRIPDTSPFALAGFDGYAADSYFSGVLIAFSEDCEQVKMATYLC